MFPFFDDLDNEPVEMAIDPASFLISIGITACMTIAAAGAVWATGMAFSL